MVTKYEFLLRFDIIPTVRAPRSVVGHMAGSHGMRVRFPRGPLKFLYFFGIFLHTERGTRWIYQTDT